MEKQPNDRKMIPNEDIKVLSEMHLPPSQRFGDHTPKYRRNPYEMPMYQPEAGDLPEWGYNLQPEVDAHYFVHPIRPGKYNFKGFGEIDLRRITLEQANDLHQRGFPFLHKKKPA